MEKLLVFLITIYIIIGLILIIYCYIPIFKKVKNQRVNDYLRIIKKSSNPYEISKAFIKLMELSYVKIHTLVEEKIDDYDDTLQSIKFSKSLTSDVIKRIKELDTNTNV